MPVNNDDITARLMNDMDPQLLDFLKTKVNSFIKLDLVRFFHENPNTADTAENIAKYAGRDLMDVKPELEELVKSGVMEMHLTAEIPIYSLTKDETMHRLVEKFIKTYCDDRRFRVQAVYHIVRGMK